MKLVGPVALPHWHSDDEFVRHVAPKFVQNCSETTKAWWAEAIESETERCQNPLISRRTITKHFTRDGLTPLCLSEVLHNMVKDRKLVPLTESGQTWMGWLARGAVRVAMATINLAAGDEPARNSKPEVPEDETFLVVKPAQQIVARMREQKGVRFVSLQELAAALGCTSPQLETPAAVRLEACGMLRRFSVGNQEYVKLHEEGKPLDVVENDRLEVAKQTLEERCEELRAQMTFQTSLAKSHLKKGAKSQAKMALRERKARENELEKREAQLLNLLRLGSSLDSAQLDSVVLAAMEGATLALAALNNQTPVEEVERITGEAGAQVEEQEQARAMLAAPLSSSDAATLQEMEEELEALMLTEEAAGGGGGAEERGKERGKGESLREDWERAVVFPAAPTAEPQLVPIVAAAREPAQSSSALEIA